MPALRESEADKVRRQQETAAIEEELRQRCEKATPNMESNRDIVPSTNKGHSSSDSRPMTPLGPRRRVQTHAVADSKDEDTSFHTLPPQNTAEQFSPSLQRIAIDNRPPINDQPVELEFTPTTSIRREVKKRQVAAQNRIQKQYGKQCQVQVFRLGDLVSIALPDTVRSFTDDSRAFGKVIGINPDLHQYQVITSYGILDRFVPVDILNPLKDTIDIELPVPFGTANVTLKQVADKQSMSHKVPVKCDCKKVNRYPKKSCAYIKAGVKCFVACHSSIGYPDTRTPCANASAMRDFTSRGLAAREDKTQAKRRRTKEGQDWEGRKTKGYVRVPEEDDSEGGGEVSGAVEDNGEGDSEGNRRSSRKRKPGTIDD
ncbi:MAG: hypothetical protein L6R38_008685 [Xanthoria sp. 2 TBL-2021]|nr:MAG: hypothetical protein L6R38_008685 [Xanthoria sp. 2 TBL-2021]